MADLLANVWAFLRKALPYLILVAILVVLEIFRPQLPPLVRGGLIMLIMVALVGLLYSLINRADFRTAAGHMEGPFLIWVIALLVLGAALGYLGTVLFKPGPLPTDTPVISWLLPELTGMPMPDENDVVRVDLTTITVKPHATYQTEVVVDGKKIGPVNADPNRIPVQLNIPADTKRIRVYYFTSDRGGRYREWLLL